MWISTPPGTGGTRSASEALSRGAHRADIVVEQHPPAVAFDSGAIWNRCRWMRAETEIFGMHCLARH